MRILLVAATEMEIHPFRNQFPEAAILVTGVGVPAVIYSLVKRLQSSAYDLVIQAGIAGTFDGRLPVGQTVFVQKDRFADIGMMENGSFTTVFQSGLADANIFPFSGGWLMNEVNLPELKHIKKVQAVTVNTVSDVLLQYDFTTVDTIETMEGAALHFVCLQEKIPFVQLRTISNKAGDRNKHNWKIQESVQNLNEDLIDLYKKLQ